MISGDHMYTFSIEYPGVSLAKHIIFNLSIFVCLMLMVSTAHANQYNVINHYSLVSHFSLCNCCSLRRLSLSSFPCSFYFHMAMHWAIPGKLNSLLSMTWMTIPTKDGTSVNLTHYCPRHLPNEYSVINLCCFIHRGILTVLALYGATIIFAIHSSWHGWPYHPYMGQLKSLPFILCDMVDCTSLIWNVSKWSRIFLCYSALLWKYP